MSSFFAFSRLLPFCKQITSVLSKGTPTQKCSKRDTCSFQGNVCIIKTDCDFDLNKIIQKYPKMKIHNKNDNIVLINVSKVNLNIPIFIVFLCNVIVYKMDGNNVYGKIFVFHCQNV